MKKTIAFLILTCFILSIRSQESNRLLLDSAQSLINQRDYFKAQDLLSTSIENSTTDSTEELLKLRALRASLYLRFGDLKNAYMDAIVVYDRAMKRSGMDSLVGSVAKTLVELSVNLGELDDARAYVRTCLDYYKRSESLMLYADGLQVKGNFLRSLNELDSSKTLLKLCVDISKKSGFGSIESKALNNLGIVYANQGYLDSAFWSFRRSLDVLAEQSLPDETICETTNNITFYYLLHGEMEKALSSARKQIALSSALKYPLTRAKGYKHLSQVFEVKGVYDSAFFYLNKYHILKDSIFTNELQQKISWNKYQSELKVIQVQNDLFRSELKNTRMKLLILSLLAAAFTVTLFILVGMYRKKMAESKVLFERVQELLQQTSSDIPNHSVGQAPEIKDDVLKSVMEGLKNWEGKNGFLEKDCTLEHVSRKCNTNSKYLSMVVSSQFAMRFPEYLNTRRILYVLEQLQSNPKLRKYTIETLSDMAGYKSKTSFGSAFKAYTGLTPSVYINELNKKLSNAKT